MPPINDCPDIQYWAHSVPLELAAHSYTRLRLPVCFFLVIFSGVSQRERHVDEFSDEGHGGCFLHVRTAFRSASSGTASDVEPGNGTGAGQRLLFSSRACRRRGPASAVRPGESLLSRRPSSARLHPGSALV